MIRWLYICLISFNLWGQTDTVEVYHPKILDPVYHFQSELLEHLITLYNRKHTRQFVVKQTEIATIEEINYTLKQLKNKKKLVTGVYGATIMKDSYWSNYFEFSIPFLPVRNAVVSRNDSTLTISKDKPFSLAYMKNPKTNSHFYVNLANQLEQEGYTFSSIYYETYELLIPALRQKTVDFIIADSIEGWMNKDLKVVVNIDKTPQFIGFIYQKGTVLKEELDSVIAYFTKSTTFYLLLKKYFGPEFRDYYIEAMKKSH